MKISELIVPVIFAFVLIFGLCRRRDVYRDFTDGVKDGLRTTLDIFPALLALTVGVAMFKASGSLELIASAIAPVTGFFNFPEEAAGLILLRPFSGSGAVALYETILLENGADSFAGRVASVILGSSETLFYTIAVYFSAAKIKKTRHTLPASFAGDLTVFVLSGLVVSFWF